VIVNRKADFLKRTDSNRFVILIDSNRESECSTSGVKGWACVRAKVGHFKHTMLTHTHCPL